MKMNPLVKAVLVSAALAVGAGSLSGCGREMQRAFWNDPLISGVTSFIPNDLAPRGAVQADREDLLKQSYEMQKQNNPSEYIPININGRPGWRKCNSAGCTDYDQNGYEVKFIPNQ